MRSLGGFVLLAGVGVGLFVYLPSPVDRNTTLEHARAVSALNAQVSAQAKSSSIDETAKAQPTRTFSPGISLAGLAKGGRHATITHEAAYRGAASDHAVPATATSGWQSVVTPTSDSLKPDDPSTRYELIVALQKELKRVGCYWGRVDGSWGNATRYAMQEFTQRVNATLPLEEPDHLLLTLLQAQKGRTCANECPAGLEMSNGRCVPQATVAQTRQPEVLPWKAAGAQQAPAPAGRPLFTPVATTAVSSAPLPGRMAIGGPKTLPPVDSLNGAADVTTLDSTGRTTAALDATRPTPPAASPPKRSKSASSGRRGRSTSDPIRRNLLLSLGGVY